MEKEIENLIKLYSLGEEKFKEYYKIAICSLKGCKTPSKNKTLIIVGGQAGAGKSKLIPLVKKELEQNAIVVDFDELRSLHPHYREVNNSYPELTHRILHPDTDRVKNEILKTLREEEYNVIYEGALRNTQGFIDFAQEFKESGYNIEMDIMSVPELESLGSTYVRFATALMEGMGPARWVEKEAHDGSYEGVTRTVQKFIETKLADNVRVFIRGRGEELPKEIYSKQGKQFKDVNTAIEYGRETRRKEAVDNFGVKFGVVRDILTHKKPELLPKLKPWQDLYDKEVSYFNALTNHQGKVSEIND